MPRLQHDDDDTAYFHHCFTLSDAMLDFAISLITATPFYANTLPLIDRFLTPVFTPDVTPARCDHALMRRAQRGARREAR